MMRGRRRIWGRKRRALHNDASEEGKVEWKIKKSLKFSLFIFFSCFCGKIDFFIFSHSHAFYFIFSCSSFLYATKFILFFSLSPSCFLLSSIFIFIAMKTQVIWKMFIEWRRRRRRERKTNGKLFSFLL